MHGQNLLLHMNTPGFVHNLAELARRVGVARGTIYKFRQFPGSPKARADGRWNVAEWKRFISQHAQRLVIAGLPLSPVEQSRLRLVQLETERQEFRLAVERGELIERAIVIRHIDTASAHFVRELRKALLLELPPRVEGLPRFEIAKIYRRRLNRLFRLLPRPLSKEEVSPAIPLQNHNKRKT